MARFSDLLGGGTDPEDESPSTPAPDRPAVRETPEEILDRLASYASQARPDEHEQHDRHDDSLADTVAHAYGRDEVPVAPRHAALDALPPVDDDLLPRKRPS